MLSHIWSWIWRHWQWRIHIPHNLCVLDTFSEGWGTILEFNICSAGCFKLVKCHLFLFSRRTRAAWAAISGKVFLLTWNLDSTSPLSFYLSLCFLLRCVIVFPFHPSSGKDKSRHNFPQIHNQAAAAYFLVCPSWVFSVIFSSNSLCYSVRWMQ